MLRCVGPRLSSSSTAGCVGFIGQWKTQTRSLAVAGLGHQPQPQNPDDNDTSEEQVRWVPITAKSRRRDDSDISEDKTRRVQAKSIRRVEIKKDTVRELDEAEALEIARQTRKIERAIQGFDWPPPEQETGHLAVNGLSPTANPRSQPATSAFTSTSSPTTLVPFEDGDLSAFTEDLSEAVDVENVEEVEPTDDWDLANMEWSQLPRSPLMDPGFIAARDKNRQPKSDPSKELSELQSLLEKNPYAIALASPVRRCSVTKVALPKFFLQNFGILGHPKTGEPCLVPRGIFNANDTKQPDIFRMGSGIVGPGMYALARYPLLQAMQSADGGFGKDPYLRLFPTRMKEKRAMNLIRRTRFREDMPDFILEQARRRIVSFIKYLWDTKVAYMVPYDDWDSSTTWAKQIGAYLWTGSKPGAATEPPEFATLESSERQHTNKHKPNRRTGQMKKGKIPVYNLKVLLGEEKMDELRSECSADIMMPLAGTQRPSIFDAPIVTLKRRRPTTSLELQLWWLQGFLAEHKNYLADIEIRDSALREERNANSRSTSYRSISENKE